MGLKQRIQGTDIKKYYIRGNEDTQFNFAEIENMILKREVIQDTEIYCTEKESGLWLGKNEWKKASSYYEFRKVFESLPPV